MFLKSTEDSHIHQLVSPSQSHGVAIIKSILQVRKLMLWEGWWLETMSYPSSLWSWSQSISLLTADNFHKILVVLVGRSHRRKKKKGQVVQTKTCNTHRPSHFACLPRDQGAFLDWRSALTRRMSAENRRDAVLSFTWLQRTVVPRLCLRISLTLGDIFF